MTADGTTDEVAVVAQFFGALARDDVGAAQAVVAEGLVAFPRVGPTEPVLRGRASLVARLASLIGQGAEIRVADLEPEGEGLVLACGTVRHEGATMEVFVLARVDAGCIVTLESHGSRDAALASAGRDAAA